MRKFGVLNAHNIDFQYNNNALNKTLSAIVKHFKTRIKHLLNYLKSTPYKSHLSCFLKFALLYLFLQQYHGQNNIQQQDQSVF